MIRFMLFNCFVLSVFFSKDRKVNYVACRQMKTDLGVKFLGCSCNINIRSLNYRNDRANQIRAAA